MFRQLTSTKWVDPRKVSTFFGVCQQFFDPSIEPQYLLFVVFTHSVVHSYSLLQYTRHFFTKKYFYFSTCPDSIPRYTDKMVFHAQFNPLFCLSHLQIHPISVCYLQEIRFFIALFSFFPEVAINSYMIQFLRICIMQLKVVKLYTSNDLFNSPHSHWGNYYFIFIMRL